VSAKGTAGSGQRVSNGVPSLRSYVIAATTVLAAVLLLSRFPENAGLATSTAAAYVRELATILPAVMVIVGLFSVFVSRDRVVKFMGKSSGPRGVVLSIVAGALPTGPLYIALPFAAALLKKGARVSNVIIMLSAWACIKLPQELFELQFLGWRFMVTRLVLTILMVVPVGIAIERIVEWDEARKAVPEA
jgi:uncharacterized membrane protein YraQ (UPF0718 family)